MTSHPAPYTIEELAITDPMSDAAYAAFDESVTMRNAIEAELVGSWALAVTTDELLPTYQDTIYEQYRLWLARIDGRVVGRGVLSWSLTEETSVAWVHAEVASEHRGMGIGSELLRIEEAEARALGKTTLQGGATHTQATGGEDIAPPTGYGTVNTADPGIRFFHKHGYALEQIARMSVITLPLDPEMLVRNRVDAQAKAGPDYRIITWEGSTPPEWRGDIAWLKQKMSTDEPNAGLEVPEEVWDEARVIKHDQQAAAGGRVMLTSVAEHIPTGKLAGINELSVPADRSRAVAQEDTLVLDEHRGHRLGMLLKVANLQELAARYPDAPLVYTFNAEENRFMLDVNEAVGFVPTAYDGLWKKVLH